jgi:hypothetical protein
MLALTIPLAGVLTDTQVLAIGPPPTVLGPPQCHGTRELRGVHDKRALAAAHGITDYWNYELDHYIPLCLGGSDDESNLQFQPWPEALDKDKYEAFICSAVCDGRLTQEQAYWALHATWPREDQR